MFLRVSGEEGLVQVCCRYGIPRWFLNSRVPVRISGTGDLPSGFVRSFPGGPMQPPADSASGNLVLTQLPCWRHFLGLLSPAKQAEV